MKGPCSGLVAPADRSHGRILLPRRYNIDTFLELLLAPDAKSNSSNRFL